MNLYLYIDEQPQGPFSFEQIHEKLAQAEITMTTLGYNEDLQEWKPLNQIQAFIDFLNSRIQPLKLAGGFRLFLAWIVDVIIVVALIFAYCSFTTIKNKIAETSQHSEMFRWGMQLMESFATHFPITTGIIGCISLLFGLFIMCLTPWFYFALFNTSPLQTTLGKMLFGIKVTDQFGFRLSLGQKDKRLVLNNQ